MIVARSSIITPLILVCNRNCSVFIPWSQYAISGANFQYYSYHKRPKLKVVIVILGVPRSYPVKVFSFIRNTEVKLEYYYFTRVDKENINTYSIFYTVAKLVENIKRFWDSNDIFYGELLESYEH